MVTRPHNTKKQGAVEFLVYKEGDVFVGVCLTFDIVEEGTDPAILMQSLKEAASLHLEAVVKNDLPEELLNRYAPDEYWKKYFEAAKNIEKPTAGVFPVVSPYYRADDVLVP